MTVYYHWTERLLCVFNTFEVISIYSRSEKSWSRGWRAGGRVFGLEVRTQNPKEKKKGVERRFVRFGVLMSMISTIDDVHPQTILHGRVGFATMAFGAARDFQVKNDESEVTSTHLGNTQTLHTLATYRRLRPYHTSLLI